MHSNPFHGENGRGCLCLLLLHWALGGWLWQVLAYPLRTFSLFTVFQWNLWMQVALTFKARGFGGPILWVKFGAWYVQSKPLTPHEDEVPSWLYATVPQGGIYGDSVSQPFLSVSMWVFFSVSWHVGVAQLVSQFPSEGITLCVNVHSVCL